MKKEVIAKLKKIEKKYLIIAGIVLILLIALGMFAYFKSNSTDGAKFKREYESYNGVASPSGKFYQNLKIDKENKVRYATLNQALEILDTETALIYFGFPDCPWCRGMITTLLDVVDCSCLEELVYVDMTDLRDTYEVKNGEVTLTTEASSAYYTLLNVLDKYLDSYIVTDSDGIEYETGEKRVYVPLVVAVKDGEVVGAHTGTVELNEDQTAYDALSETQKSELKIIYNDLIDKITKEENVCDEHC